MATRGQRPKPAKLHVVEGTFRPARHAAQAEAEPQPTGPLQKPAYLKGKAGKIWDRRAPELTWLTSVDSDALAGWCILQETLETARHEMTAALWSQWRMLQSELGMVPAGRARIGAGNGKKKPDNTDGYF